VAALAAGLASFDPALEVAGVIANRVGGRSHLELLDRALAAPAPAGLRCPRLVGGFPVEATLTFPARHLGLRTAGEHAALEDQLTAWGERAAAWCDLDALLGIAGRAEPIAAAPANPPTSPPTTASAPAPGRVRIAVAQDEAFHFYYEDNLRRLELAGAELVRFSPLADGELPPGIAGVYLGGGYPELHAERLADNAALRAAMRTAAAAGVPIYGECGGLMYLCEAIETRDGRRHPMLGLLPGVAVMQERLVALGYVEVETQVRTLLGGAGTRFRGHQFRYSQLRDLPGDLEHAFRVRRRRDGSAAPEGYRRGSVLGTYVHAHWASNPQAAAELVAACAGREVG
jgi:cobyrinic acid a,c-diamide synthase